MSERQRCLTVGCNPKLKSPAAATQHAEATGHRTAKWPVRSAEGKRRARVRNRTGYYDRYNVGAKSAEARGFAPAGGSSGPLCEGEDGDDYWGDSTGGAS